RLDLFAACRPQIEAEAAIGTRIGQLSQRRGFEAPGPAGVQIHLRREPVAQAQPGIAATIGDPATVVPVVRRNVAILHLETDLVPPRSDLRLETLATPGQLQVG